MENKTKVRKTVNVSIGKRHSDRINSILNEWEDEGLNISSEICESILFKDICTKNIATCTILSTLSLIKSTLKSNKNYNKLSSSELDELTSQILCEVLSVDIDNLKLIKLLKGESLDKIIDVNFNKPTNENIDNKLDNNLETNDLKSNIVDDTLKLEDELKLQKKDSPIIWSDFPSHKEEILVKEEVLTKKEISNNELNSDLFASFATNNSFN
jgi:hypothetical protein